MCRPFHVVPYSEETKRNLQGPSIRMEKVIVDTNGRKGIIGVRSEKIPTVRVVEMSEAEHHKLREGHEILVIDSEGFLRKGKVEYEPKFKGTKFLEVKIRYGKSDRATVKYSEEGRQGPMLVRKAEIK